MRVVKAVMHKASCASSLSGAVYWAWYMHRAACVIALIAIGALACMMVPDALAFADFDVKNPIGSILDDLNNQLIENSYNVLANSVAEPVVRTYDSLLTGGSQDQGYQLIKRLTTGPVKAVGYSIVAICAMIKVVEIGSRLDSSEVAVEIRDVFFTMLICVVLFVLVNKSFELCEQVYRLFAWLSQSIAIENLNFMTLDQYKDIVVAQNDKFPFAEFTFLNILNGGAMLGSIVSFFVQIARFLQIYVFTLFAPISLAFLANDETKQWGVGYIKNYAAICLAGVILVVLISLYPVLLSRTSWGLGYELVAIELLYIYALIKSGAWARDVLGG